jgi:hypothetical protein
LQVVVVVAILAVAVAQVDIEHPPELAEVEHLLKVN